MGLKAWWRTKEYTFGWHRNLNLTEEDIDGGSCNSGRNLPTVWSEQRWGSLLFIFGMRTDVFYLRWLRGPVIKGGSTQQKMCKLSPGSASTVFPASVSRLCHWGNDSKMIQALAGVAQLVGTFSHKSKGCRFDSWSGHMPRLQVWSPVGVSTRGNWSMFLSCIDVSLLLSPPPFPSF